MQVLLQLANPKLAFAKPRSAVPDPLDERISVGALRLAKAMERWATTLGRPVRRAGFRT